MSKFRLKSETVEATRWFKNGDHPLDKPPGSRVGDEGKFVGYSKGKDSFLNSRCDRCKMVMRIHGEINRLGEMAGGGQLYYVCPGGWVITHPDDEIETLRHDEFMERYEEVDDRGAPMTMEPEMRRLMGESEVKKNPYDGKPIFEMQCPTCKFDVGDLDVCMQNRRRIQRDEAKRFFKAVDCPLWEFGKEISKPIVNAPILAPIKKKRGRPKFMAPSEVKSEG